MSKIHSIAVSFQKNRTQPEFWFHCLLYFCLIPAFLPLSLWIANTANTQSRLLHALITLGLAIFLLVLYGRTEITAPLTFNRSARRTLFASYGIVFFSFILSRTLPQAFDLVALLISMLTIPAYCLGLASLALFIFGDRERHIIYTASGTFCAFILLSTLMAPLDWPLRTLAAQWSGSGLAFLGKSVELSIVTAINESPKLILNVDGQPFHVASECNGFGVMLTGLLIGVLLSIYHKHGMIDSVLNLLSAIILGFAFNTLRILIIILLAPAMMAHYHLMHEIVGVITYWGCLIVIWLLLKGTVKSPLDDAAASQRSRSENRCA